MTARLKRLTTCDLARRIYADEQLKKSLVEAVMPLVRKKRTAGIEKEVLSAIEKTLMRAASKDEDPATYHVTCASCALDIAIETSDWPNAGVSIQCCVCDEKALLPLPELSCVVPCKVCGAETTITKISAKT